MNFFPTQSKPRKIVIGAGPADFLTYAEWECYQQADLDARDQRWWAELFPPNSIDVCLAEHVWEHLHPQEAMTATRNVYRHLKPGGFFRCATPDGLHPDARYIDWVRPGGVWNPDDHLWLPNYRSLAQMLASAGFTVRPCAWWTEDGAYHQGEWCQEDAPISRTPGSLNNSLISLFVGCWPEYTSLILDGVKPR